MSKPDEAGPGAFPSKDIVLGSFMLPFSHFGLYLRSAWLSLAAFVAASLVITSILPLPPAPPEGNDLAQLIEYMTAPGGLLEVLAYEIVSLVLLVPAITIWIRLTVYGPPEDGRFPLLSLGGAEVRYLSAYVLIALMSLGAMIGVMIAAILAVRILSAIIGMLAGGVGTALMNLTSIAGFALGLAAFVYVTSRFMPALGATALGDAFDVKRGWAETKPQAWPLFWSLVSFAGILFLAQLALMIGFGMVLPSGVWLLGGAIRAAIQALGILLACAYIGRVYAYFRT
ncbi:MAG: hypothetical protein RLW87_03515 [Alphaproteobacteria bacterium]